MAGASVAALFPGVGPVTLSLGAAAGAALGHLLRAPPAPPQPWWPAALALLFFIPAITMPVAPGADMAMHVALARSLEEGLPRLSPAWGTLRVALYPRGFSGLVALVAPVVGLAKAGLVVAGATYLLFWTALSAWLAAPLVAALALLLSRSPQSFFGWGGNPTVLAIALSLHAAAFLRRGGSPWVSALLVVGAGAIHPMGACAGALAIAVVARERPRAATVSLAALGALLLLLARFGPLLSPRELAWIRAYAINEESVLRGSPWLFPLSVWTALPRVLGDPYVVAISAAAALLLVRQKVRPVLVAVSGVLLVGAVFAAGSHLPLVPLYPARFTPMLVVATARLLSHAATQLPRRALAPLLAVLFGIALALHVRWFQEAQPMATAADLLALKCLDETLPPGVVIDGAYGDATQWIPALTGRPVTRPHQHCSLFDETDAQLAKARPQYRYIGERLRYPGAAVERPAGLPICPGLFALP